MPLDMAYGPEDFGEREAEKLRAEAWDFFTANLLLLEYAVIKYPYHYGRAGHDFWLTRNGHGAGYWDRGLGEVGDALTTAAEVYGSCDLYVGDDGKIYC